MENPLMMVVHSVIIGFIAYMILIHLSYSYDKALNRSVLLGSLACTYMVVFGHKLPGKDSINTNL